VSLPSLTLQHRRLRDLIRKIGVTEFRSRLSLLNERQCDLLEYRFTSKAISQRAWASRWGISRPSAAQFEVRTIDKLVGKSKFKPRAIAAAIFDEMTPAQRTRFRRTLTAVERYVLDARIVAITPRLVPIIADRLGITVRQASWAEKRVVRWIRRLYGKR
jgi:hypothetical protein